MKVQLTLKSGNEKTGPIPVSMTTRDTCPNSCSFKGKDPVTGKSRGCYAEGYHLGVHWSKVETRGVDWRQFCNQIAALPEGQLWRHNQAGDLPGQGDSIDQSQLQQLVSANTGKRGFTYTHKPITGQAARRSGASGETVRANRAAVSDANLRGFTINVSCDSLEELDDLGTALPAVVVLPALQEGEEEPGVLVTPRGNRVVVCPAQTRDNVSCATCQLCSRVNRSCAVGFRAHGFAKRVVSLTVVK